MPFNPASLKNLRQYAGRAPQQPAPTVAAVASEESAAQSVENRAVEAPAAVAGSVENQRLELSAPILEARGVLDASAPAAAVLLQRLVTGAKRAPAHVQANAAIKILEATGLMGQPKQPKGPGDPPEHIAAALAALGRAFALRERKATAVDAEPAGSPAPQ